MLSQIQIKDFAIIHEISVDLRAGFTVFTGETGAGKSILVEALGLTLGDRAEPLMVRSGARRAVITAVFDVTAHPELNEFLSHHGLDTDANEIILRRQIDSDGKSRAFCNGLAVPAQMLRDIGQYLIEVHGQHAHHSLLRREAQRALLDEYGTYGTVLANVAQTAQQWQQTQDHLLSLSGATPGERNRELDLLRYQASELQALRPQDNELAGLESEHRRLSNVATITNIATQLQEQISDGEICAENLLRRADKAVHSLIELDPRLQPVADLLRNAIVAVDEAASEIRQYLHTLDADPGALLTIESRLSALHDLARKHHISIDQLPALLQQTQQRLLDLENHENRIAELEAALRDQRQAYEEAANQLLRHRRETAARLSGEITKNLQELGMPGGRVEIVVEQTIDAEPASHGNHRVDFLVSANPGQPLRPLAKIASGGELSRISLAIQVAGANDKAVSSMVFDEIDVGIGGGVAEILGRQLRKLSATCQVLCVTHHAQVAAQAHQHFKAEKYVTDGVTIPSVKNLGQEQRVQEIARMLGGVTISERALAHAAEMLAPTLKPTPKKSKRPASA